MANAILAAILSFFIPGLGQIYAGELQKGLIFIVILIVIIAIQHFVPDLTLSIIIGLIHLGYDIYAAYDAYKLASLT